MTEYSDIPQANALRQELEMVENAIKLIDDGGLMSSFVIAPPVQPPGTEPFAGMASSISTQGTPPSPEVMATLRAWLVQRGADIVTALAALGVTSTPPARI